MPQSFDALDRAIDGLLERLGRGASNGEARTLRVEAMRLRSVIAKWRTIPPTPEAFDEMLHRVLYLSSRAPASDASAASDLSPMLASSLGSRADEDASVPWDDDAQPVSLDLEPRLYTLDLPPEPRRSAAAAGSRRALGDGLLPPMVDGPRVSSRFSSKPRGRGADEGSRREAGAASSGSRRGDRALLLPPEVTLPTVPARAYEAWPAPEVDDSEAISTPLIATRRSSVPNDPPKARPAGEAARAPFDTLNRESVEPAPHSLGLPLSVMPVKLGEKLDPQLVMLSDMYSARADVYRALRRKLAAAAGDPRCIAITSPERAEGKTTCAINLALAIREGARGKVLLVEANLRTPSLAKTLGFEPPACFGEQLMHHKTSPSLRWIVAEPFPQVHVLAVDPKGTHAPMLDALAFGATMEQLRSAGYASILVDTPPVLGGVDVNMVADAVDGVLFTSITMKSKKGPFRKAVAQLAPAPILGVVVLDS